MVASYNFTLGNQSSLKLTGGIHTSSDDGKLFVTGAESAELDDEDVPGSKNGVTDSDNDGKGIYLAANWKLGNVELGAAAAKFDGAWIEDNFAGDHGTNPFPPAEYWPTSATTTNRSGCSPPATTGKTISKA